MKKRIILTESDIRRIVSESIAELAMNGFGIKPTKRSAEDVKALFNNEAFRRSFGTSFCDYMEKLANDNHVFEKEYPDDVDIEALESLAGCFSTQADVMQARYGFLSKAFYNTVCNNLSSSFVQDLLSDAYMHCGGDFDELEMLKVRRLEAEKLLGTKIKMFSRSNEHPYASHIIAHINNDNDQQWSEFIQDLKQRMANDFWESDERGAYDDWNDIEREMGDVPGTGFNDDEEEY